MATDVMSLFNMPSQEQLGRNYLEGMLTSPQQMGAQSLLQQVVSLGGNAGAMLGYGAGRLMGGMTADEVRAKSIDDAMRDVHGMGLKSDAEMYAALSQQLASRGLTQDALKARDAAFKAAQVEQGMAIEQQKLGISKEDLALRKDAAAREAELLPVKIDALKVDISNKKEEFKTTEEQLAEALKAGNIPRAEGLQRRLDAYKKEIDFKERELTVRERQASASETQASAAMKRADQAEGAGSFTKTEYMEFIPGQKTPIGKYSAKLGQFQANDGSLFNTRKELEDYATSLAKQQAPQPAPATKNPQKPLSAFGG
jgi:hypothetical protein